MRANVNEKTGISYGVVSSRTFHWLAEDIFNNGTNLADEGAKEEMRQDAEALAEKYNCNDNVADEIAEILQQNAQLEQDEPEYDYDAGNTKYHLGYLGGAPLIWICESKWVCPCRTCSPCVPNAGDLDSPAEWEHANNLAYCPDPDEWKAAYEESNDMKLPHFIFPVEDGDAQSGQPFDLWGYCGKVDE